MKLSLLVAIVGLMTISMAQAVVMPHRDQSRIAESQKPAPASTYRSSSAVRRAWSASYIRQQAHPSAPADSPVLKATPENDFVYFPFVSMVLPPTPTPTLTPMPTSTPTWTPTTLPPGVAVLSNHSSSVDLANRLHLAGEVSNNTDGDLAFVNITADFFDDSGQLIGSASAYTYLVHLPAHDRTCFELSLPQPAHWSTYQFESPTYLPAGRGLPDLTVLGDRGSYDRIYFRYEILGQVRNDETTPVDLVSPVGTVYDASGMVLGCALTSVSSTNLDPGQVSAFEMDFVGRTFADVASYRLQVDGYPR